MMAMVDVVAAYRRANGSSLWAWSKDRRPSGAVLDSSREPVVRRPCSDFMAPYKLSYHYYYYYTPTVTLNNNNASE